MQQVPGRAAQATSNATRLTHKTMGKVRNRHRVKKNKYLMIGDYYSRFPVIRLLSNITADTTCNHFTSVLAEYCLPSVTIAEFGTQYISAKFKDSCTKSGITLTFSSPYHHQANSLTERAVGTCKSLWKKAVEGGKCPYTAVFMYRVTPLGNNMPSSCELLLGRKPRSNNMPGQGTEHLSYQYSH